MKRFTLLILLLIVCFLSGCSTVSVYYDFDNKADFSAIRTYNWGEGNGVDDELSKNQLLKNRIVVSIDNYLQSRGYRKVDPAHADVLVVIEAGVKEKMRVTDWGGPGGYYRNPWYDPWWGGSAYRSRVDVSYYQEGTLVIDIIDNVKKELIWRGLGTGIVQRQSDQKKKQAAIDEYVQEILNHFPPGYEKTSK